MPEVQPGTAARRGANGYGGVKGALLRLLKVPPEPDPPAGHAGTLLTFRAAPNYYRYKLALWGIGQIFALIFLLGLAIVGVVVAVKGVEGLGGCLLSVGLGLAFSLILTQLMVSFLAVRLDYEMRWYLVTDQSLRIREGIFQVREMTMTFANVQNISISQGPLQRLLGVSDLEVKSAGGGGTQHAQQAQAFSMHTGYFRGVDNAEELRDLMRRRMLEAKGTGLGDPDDVADGVAGDEDAEAHGESHDLASVLEELRAEARALRQAAQAAR